MVQRRSSRRRDEDGVSFPPLFFVVCLGLAAALMYADRPQARVELLSQVRASFNDATLPVLALVDEPLRGASNIGPWWRRHFELAEENVALRREIAELQSWRDVAQSLQERNARYREVLNLQGPIVGERITAWTVADQSTDFVRARLLAAGSNAGVESGFPVVNVYGLVGRTVDVGERSSRALLLTDFNSRISVMADRSNARALLVGDNSEFPRLDYLGREPDLQVGDRIVTSGDDNVMPRGLPVGEAILDRDGRWRVALFHRAAPIDLVWIWPYEPVPSPEDDLTDAGSQVSGGPQVDDPSDTPVGPPGIDTNEGTEADSGSDPLEGEG